jgi:drug/metabolite transporter (DMT)-like permease
LCSFALGNICDFIALGIAPLSVVTLLGSWSLVVTTLLAKSVANEAVSIYNIISIILIVIGIIMTVLGSDHRPNEWPLPRLIKHYEEPQVIVFLLALAFIVAAGLLTIHRDFVVRNTRINLDENFVIARPGKNIRALYVIVGSVAGNFTALFGKAFAGLLLFTFSGEDQFNNPFVVLIVVIFVVSLPLQIYLINASLAVNDILYHIPNFYVFWNVGNILTGAIFYDETNHFSTSNWVFYLIGVAFLFGGVVCTNIAATRKPQLAN